MKTLTLSPSEKQQIEDLDSEIKRSSYAMFEEHKIFDKLFNTRNNIVQRLCYNCNNKIMDFYEFTNCMIEVFGMITPEMAYTYGKLSKKAGVDYKTAFAAFLNRISKITGNSEAAAKYEELLEGLREELGDAGVLIDDFFLLYTIISAEGKQRERFFDLGYWGDKVKRYRRFEQ